MDLNDFFDKKVEENFDIKSKRISMLENYGENFQKKFHHLKNKTYLKKNIHIFYYNHMKNEKFFDYIINLPDLNNYND